MKTYWHVFRQQARRERLLWLRQPRLAFHATIFFVMMLVFFPMTLTASSQLLQEVGPGLAWIAFLFAILLSSEGLFQRAYEEGLLEQAWVSGEPLWVMVLAIFFVHLVFIMLPIILFFPFLSVLYGLSLNEIAVLCASFICGVPALLCLSMLASALNVGKTQKTTLMALLVLPLTVPVMIFGSAVTRLLVVPGGVAGVLALLGAFSLLCMMGVPFAVAAVLRLRFED